jgi:hypothetical protein
MRKVGLGGGSSCSGTSEWKSSRGPCHSTSFWMRACMVGNAGCGVRGVRGVWDVWDVGCGVCGVWGVGCEVRGGGNEGFERQHATQTNMRCHTQVPQHSLERINQDSTKVLGARYRQSIGSRDPPD